MKACKFCHEKILTAHRVQQFKRCCICVHIKNYMTSNTQQKKNTIKCYNASLVADYFYLGTSALTESTSS